MLTAYWISFTNPPTWLTEESGSLRIGDVIHVDAVRADQHHEWVTSGAESDPLSIGKGAAGCLLAHRNAWTLIAKAHTNQYALVLESDAVSTNYARRYTGNLLQQASRIRPNLIQIGSNRSNARGDGLGSRLGSILHYATQTTESRILRLRPPIFHQAFASGTHAYLVRPDYCKWLSGWQPDFKIPVDQWLHTLARDHRHQIFRSRQDFWTTCPRPSEVEREGR